MAPHKLVMLFTMISVFSGKPADTHNHQNTVMLTHDTSTLPCFEQRQVLKGAHATW